MSVHRFSYAIVVAGTFWVLFNSGCAKNSQKQPEDKKEAGAPEPSKPAASVPNITVTTAVQKMADSSKAGPKATRKTALDTFGRGRASITVKGHPGGVNHSFWSEEVDIDGSGNPVQVDEAWDNHHKVVYLSSDRTFTCGNGQPASGSTLMTVYGKGNTLNKPVASGWWVSELDRGQCAVAEAGTYGCHFDANGNNTDCGVATVQSEQDDVEIVPLPGATSDPLKSDAPDAQKPRQNAPSPPQAPPPPPGSER